MLIGVHHAGIVVRSLAEAYRFYRDTLGLPLVREAEVRDQGVRAALLAAGPGEVELLEPLHDATGIGRFLARRGEGLHHVCFETPDVGAALLDLQRREVELIDSAPREGLAGRIAFLHPRACAGILVELATPPVTGSHAPAGPYRLTRVVVGSRDARGSLATLGSVLELPVAGARLVSGAGAVEILSVEAAGSEGLSALAFDVDDARALKERCQRARVPLSEAGDQLVIDAGVAHGARLRFRVGAA